MIFTKEEEAFIYQLAEELTGSNQQGTYKREILISNVRERMVQLKFSHLGEYLEFATSDNSEHAYLMSALTIHTTSWFRESPHFESIKNHIVKHNLKSIKLKSVACSTGEEVYSLAIYLKHLKIIGIITEFSIDGCDIDPISVQFAKTAIYKVNRVQEIPLEYRQFLLIGTGKTQGYFTVDSDIRANCNFEIKDIRTVKSSLEKTKYDFIICRNVLIYFSPNCIEKIISNFFGCLKPDGLLVLGHSEVIDYKKFNLVNNGRSTYVKNKMIENKVLPLTVTPLKYKILVIDDSKTIQSVFKKRFIDSGFDVITADDTKEAFEKVRKEPVDLITLDLYLPNERGDEWLLRFRKENKKIPVIIISGTDSPEEAISVVGALDKGAQDFFKKDDINKDFNKIISRINSLLIKESSTVPVDLIKREINPHKPELILIGASTGGVQALTELLANFPKPSPPIVVVQHIAADFSGPFADRLSNTSGLPLEKIEGSTTLKPSTLYMAKGDYHLEIVKNSIITSNKPPVVTHRPSIDILFSSATHFSGSHITSIILTGMGSDGAQGMKELFAKGSYTMVQDEASSVVFGMPQKALLNRCVKFVGNIGEIRANLIEQISRLKKTA